MRISILLKREPFGEILEQTLSSFLQSRTGDAHSVRWLAARSVVASGQKWFCNPYLNVIFVGDARREVFEPAIREFSRSTKPWRGPLQKLYVLLASRSPTSRLLATSGIEVSPGLVGAERCAIIGGNHHIRLLDYGLGRCFVIGKAGFNARLMTEEIRVRQAFPYLPTPEIKEVGADSSWYGEELILGTPVNRLEDPRQGEVAVETIAVPLSRLYDDTAETVAVAEYATGIVKRTEELITVNRHFSQNDRDLLFTQLSALLDLAVTRSGDTTTIVQCHGDFQPANILVGEGRCWLIDWEYTACRQLAYDFLVYSLASRAPVGLGLRLHRLLEEGVGYQYRLFGWLPRLSLHTREDRRATLALFLLEELELKLSEMSNPLLTTLDVGYRRFSEEVRCSLAVL